MSEQVNSRTTGEKAKSLIGPKDPQMPSDWLLWTLASSRMISDWPRPWQPENNVEASHWPAAPSSPGISAKDVPSPRHQMLLQCSCVPTPRLAHLAKIPPSGFQVTMSQAIDIQLFLPSSYIATQDSNLMYTKRFLLQSSLFLFSLHHQNCPKKFFKQLVIIFEGKISNLIWNHGFDCSENIVYFCRVVDESVPSFSGVNQVSTYRYLSKWEKVWSSFISSSSYLKDIVSLDAFSGDVKFISKLKPVLDVSPYGLHSTSHDGSIWRTLTRRKGFSSECLIMARIVKLKS